MIIPIILVIFLKISFFEKFLVILVLSISYISALICLVLILEKLGKIGTILLSNIIFALIWYILELFFGRAGLSIKYICEGLACWVLIPPYVITFLIFFVNSFFVCKEFHDVGFVSERLKGEKTLFWISFIIFSLVSYIVVTWIENNYFLNRIMEGLGLILLFLAFIISFFVAKYLSNKYSKN